MVLSLYQDLLFLWHSRIFQEMCYVYSFMHVFFLFNEVSLVPTAHDSITIPDNTVFFIPTSVENLSQMSPFLYCLNSAGARAQGFIHRRASWGMCMLGYTSSSLHTLPKKSRCFADHRKIKTYK